MCASPKQSLSQHATAGNVAAAESYTTINILVIREKSQKHFWVISHKSTSEQGSNQVPLVSKWEYTVLDARERSMVNKRPCIQDNWGLWLLIIVDHLSKNPWKLQKNKKCFILGLSAIFTCLMPRRSLPADSRDSDNLDRSKLQMGWEAEWEVGSSHNPGFDLWASFFP